MLVMVVIQFINVIVNYKIMETIKQLSQKTNSVISQPTKEEINSIILFYAKIREDDENRCFPNLNRDPENMIDYYLDAKESLFYSIKIEVTPKHKTATKITFFHCSLMWDLSSPDEIDFDIPFINEVLVLENNALHKYHN